MRRKLFVNAAGFLLLFFGMTTMGGWVLRVPFWEAISPAGTVVVFQTAFCFALAGISLAAPLVSSRHAQKIRVVSGSGLMAISLLMLAEMVLSIDLGIDLAPIHRWYLDSNPHPGRMAPNTAISFLFSGMVFFQKGRGWRTGPFSYALPAMLITLGLIGLVGYTLLFDLAYEWYDFSRMAVFTALGIIVIGLALIFDRQDIPAHGTGQTDASASRITEDARIYAFLGVAATIIGLAFFVSYGSIRTLMERTAWVEHTDGVRNEFETMMAVDSRGYYAWRSWLFTGEKASLEEAVSAGGEMSKHMARLRKLTADNPAQTRKLDGMQQLIEKNDALLSGYDITSKSGRARMVRMALMHEPELLANRKSFYSIAITFRDEENRLMTQRQAQSKRSAETTVIVIIVGNVLGFAILFFAAWLLKRQNDLRDLLTASMQRTNTFLDSLIENIPNMVFVKDADDLRFVRFNKAGEKLTGIPRAEMLGKNDYDFFPKAEADFFTEKDKTVLAGTEIVEIPSESIHTRDKGVRVLHTKKIPVRDDTGKTRYLLGISEDITEREKAEREIVVLNNDLKIRATQLESVNKELESFTYSVSHDLRAPLRAINGYAQMLEEDYQDKLGDEGKRYIFQIRHQSTQMGALIDDLLRFSRLGRQAIAATQLDMTKLVKDTIANNLDGIASGNSAITVAELPSANADPVLLRQAWVNLLSNAVKYSSKVEQPSIEVKGYRTGSEVVYSVKDNGVGFDMAYSEKLFSVFQRLHRADEFPGTGVGLAIVQRVVSRHGGRVWATAKVGQGAEFFFSLPTVIAAD